MAGVDPLAAAQVGNDLIRRQRISKQHLRIECRPISNLSNVCISVAAAVVTVAVAAAAAANKQTNVRHLLCTTFLENNNIQ